MNTNITWHCRPDHLEFRRIAWADCPSVIQSAFSRRKGLYEFLGPENIDFVFDGYRITVYAPSSGCTGPICDLASIPWFVPPILASRNNQTNHLDAGALVHDMLHLGVASFPGVSGRMAQARLADAVMLALWQEMLPEPDSRFRVRRWWGRTRPTRKYWSVRALSPVLFRPDCDHNTNPEWMTIERV